MRTAVFITPDSLLSQQGSGEERNAGGGTVFRLASHAVKAINRLKKAGFLIIGLGGTKGFQGFATQSSCSEFLMASALDDVIIPNSPDDRQQCASAMIQAATKWLLDLDRSFFIGRDDEDIMDAHLTGCTPLRIDPDGSHTRSVPGSTGLPAVVDQILALDSASAERF